MTRNLHIRPSPKEKILLNFVTHFKTVLTNMQQTPLKRDLNCIKYNNKNNEQKQKR